jgi:hypothetical protein
MERQTLGDFHINLQSHPTISDDHSFNRKFSKKLSNNLALHRSACLSRWGILVRLSKVYWQSSNLSKSSGTSPISLTLSLYMECNAHSVVICKGVGSKQHMPLTRPFQGNHERTNERVQHGWEGISTSG